MKIYPGHFERSPTDQAQIVRAYLTVNNLTLHYTVAGQGAPAVLVHGHASSSQIWERMVAAYLGEHYRCYALDLPGHGASMKLPLAWYTLENFTQTLHQFCQALGLTEVVLFGHSMGGLLSLSLALAHPRLVTRLVLVAPAVRGSFLAYLQPLLWLEGLAQRPIAEQLLQLYNRHAWIGMPVGLNWYAQPKMVLSESFKRCQADFARCPATALFGNFKMIRRADVSRRLGQLQPPTLVISGDQDRVVPVSQARLIAEQVPQAELVIIPRSGHLPFDEQPGLFDTAVKEYLAV